MYLILFLLAFLLSFWLTTVVRKILLHKNIVDRPRVARKIHKKPIAVGGGLAIFVTFFVVVGIAYLCIPDIAHIPIRSLVGVFIASTCIMIGGYFDDRYTLRPLIQSVFPALAALIVVLFGIGPEIIGLPTGKILELDAYAIAIPRIGTWMYLADIITFVWLLTISYSTKLLDGLDGLVSGIVAIGAIMIFFLTQQAAWFQPEVSVLAIVLAGAAIGFLMWNFYPAVIFLGEGGSILLGFLLGVLAIISGSKIATALLVMAIPVFDILGVIIKRIFRKAPITQAGHDHLHYELLSFGVSHRAVVIVLYAISIVFGVSTLFLNAFQKGIVLILLGFLLIVASVYLGLINKNRSIKS